MLAGERGELVDLPADALLLLERDATGSTMSPNDDRGGSMPGITTSASASIRYWTIIIAWLRSSIACA